MLVKREGHDTENIHQTNQPTNNNNLATSVFGRVKTPRALVPNINKKKITTKKLGVPKASRTMVSRSVSMWLVLLVPALLLSMASAFAPIVPAAVELNNAIIPSLPMMIATSTTTTATTPSVAAITAGSSSYQLQQGINNYISGLGEDGISSSTMSLSLKDRPPPPTKEEIAAKKRNFNLWFWGGGFVAPFISTIYYFGPKFWKK